MESDCSHTFKETPRQLKTDQYSRLNEVLGDVYRIDSYGNFPALNVRPWNLIKLIKDRLEEAGVKMMSAELSGGAASYVMSAREKDYNDLDLMFLVDFNFEENFEKFNTIRTIVLTIIKETYMLVMKNLHNDQLTEYFDVALPLISRAYVHKMIKVPSNYQQRYQLNCKDCWSLISLRNNDGRNIEFKFVQSMKRQYEFSSHSFHIILNEDYIENKCNLGLPLVQKNIYETNENVIYSETETEATQEKNCESMTGISEVNDVENESEHTDVIIADLEETIDDAQMETNSLQIVLSTTNQENISRSYSRSEGELDDYEGEEEDEDVEKEEKGIVEGEGETEEPEDDDEDNVVEEEEEIGESIQQEWDEDEERELEEEAEEEPDESIITPVFVKTYYISFDDAVHHLNKHLIHVYKPEEIRGGGFLKYCHLIMLGYKHENEKKNKEQNTVDRNVMAMRFSIDFEDRHSQWRALKVYLSSHFWGKRIPMISFLHKVSKIITQTNLNNKQMTLDLVNALINQNTRRDDWPPTNTYQQPQPQFARNMSMQFTPFYNRGHMALPMQIQQQPQQMKKPAKTFPSRQGGGLSSSSSSSSSTSPSPTNSSSYSSSNISNSKNKNSPSHSSVSSSRQRSVSGSPDSSATENSI